MGNHQRIDERMAIRPVTNVYGVKDVQSQAFVVELAKYLKRSGKIVLPKYVDYVKTGVAKELAPYNPDWFYIRAAALARRAYVRPGTGVGGFRKVYSTSKKKGVVPEHQSLASGALIRNALQHSRPWACWRRIPREAVASPRRDASRSTVL